jgi:2-polyprenyl-3-methyl-5-hydroxy-6-metoxy-1,4-benzoquinol methylase
LLNLISIKKLEILDFGCGNGVWELNKINNKRIKKIVLYDKNKKLLPKLRKKYKNIKIKINFNFNSLVNNKKYNLIIFSSVIQYIRKSDFIKIIEKITKNKKNKIFIAIIDIPFLPRPLEFILMPFFNLRRFFYVLKIFFLKKYKKLDYYTYKKNDFNSLKKKFKIKYIRNLHDLIYLRYSLILESR